MNDELSEYEKIRLRNIREKDMRLEAFMKGTPWKRPRRRPWKQLHPKKFVRPEPKKETVNEENNEKKDEECWTDLDENNNEPEKPNEIAKPRKKVQEEGVRRKRGWCGANRQNKVDLSAIRERKQVNYMEEEIPNADEFIFCDICKKDYLNGCPDHLISRSDSEFAYLSTHPAVDGLSWKVAKRESLQCFVRGSVPSQLYP